MKTLRLLFTLLTASLMLPALLTGCKEEKKYRIGVSQCSADDWRMKMNDEIMREMFFHPDATVEIRSADDNNEKQIADIRYFKDNGFDIIIAAPNEKEAITPVIKEVYDAGIPVVIFDRMIEGESYTALVGVDNERLGSEVAAYCRDLLGDNFNVLEIYGLKGSTPAIGRHDGFVKGISQYPGINILASEYADWNEDDAVRVVDSLLNVHPDVQLIYAHNDRMAIGASKVAKSRGRDDIKIVGIDAAPNIGLKAVEDDTIDATFLYPTEGHLLIRTAMSILKGEPFQRKLNLPLSPAVDKSNAELMMIQNETLQEETGRLEDLKKQLDHYWIEHHEQTRYLYTALAILALLIAFTLIIIRTLMQRRKNQKSLQERNEMLEKERAKQDELNEQLNTAIQSKLMFFTNVSHDLRTPLTLISEPVEQLAAADYLTPQHKTIMKVANKNVKILRRLINQILDFRKYENGKLDLFLSEVNLGELMLDWSEAFQALARKRDIKLLIDIEETSESTCAVDVEKMERIFFNLFSNAFKYTPDNGKIHFTYGCNGQEVRFSVEDSGIGIPQEEIDNIFDRFFQVDKVHPRGSGIGLSLVKAFVELHGGTVTASSQPGKGSKFTVRIPVRHVDASYVPDSLRTSLAESMEEIDTIELSRAEFDESKPVLLVVDDNEDIRKLITELMQGEYNVVTAQNGQEGIRLAAKYVPDLIICDVMMPVMDGYECCRRIKTEVTTSHIPLLMLTACSMEEQRVQTYESGADGYISKPFNYTLLKSRCRSLIDNRKRIKDIYEHSDLPGAGDRDEKPETGDSQHPAMPNDLDSEFYRKFLAVIERNISNPDLTAEDIAAETGLGRSQCYRKIKALTNYSPTELLRNIRLKKGRDLIVSSELSVSEIAYKVGFSDPGYFTKCFRRYFGKTPSELRENITGKG